tara:strand:+ start:26 stop:325 length:300 start_codon:yes stop_codon:yes gene_type:complete
MKTQIGQLVGANLHEGTLEIEVGEDIIAKAGKYAVVPIEEYERLVKFSLDAVSESAFMVHVNHKCIVVLAKTVQDVHDKLRADGVEWKTISVEAIDGTI